MSGIASAAPLVIRLGADDFAYVDAGFLEGLVVGDRVCLHDDADTLVTCGIAVGVGRHMARVEVPKAAWSRLSLGMRVRSPKLKLAAKVDEPAAPPRSRSLPPPEPEPEPEPKPEPTPAEEAPAPAPETPTEVATATATAEPPTAEPAAPVTKRRQASMRFEVGPLVSARAPFAFSIPNYDLDAEIAGKGSLWEPDTTSRSTLLGLAFGLNIPFSHIWSVAPSVRYRYFAPDSVSVDYDRSEPANFVKISTTARSMGAALDLRRHFVAGPLDLAATVGADVDRSLVEVAAKSGGKAAATNVADFSSSLTVLSGRLGLGAYADVGKLGVGLGVTGLVPLTGKAKVGKNETRLKPEVTTVQENVAPQDLERTVDHEKASWGLEIAISLTLGL